MHDSDQKLTTNDSKSPDKLIVAPGTAIPLSEIEWTFSRSGGPGGQHANTAATRVTLRFNVDASPSLTRTQKEKIRDRLKRRIDQNGVFQLVVEDERSQHQNRRIAIERFRMKLKKALKPAKKRKSTSVPPSQKEERLKEKRRRAELKEARRRGRRLMNEGDYE